MKIVVYGLCVQGKVYQVCSRVTCVLFFVFCFGCDPEQEPTIQNEAAERLQRAVQSETAERLQRVVQSEASKKSMPCDLGCCDMKLPMSNVLAVVKKVLSFQKDSPLKTTLAQNYRENSLESNKKLLKVIEDNVLVVIRINPESRVKVDSGVLTTGEVCVLEQGNPRLVVVKVINEAGVTSRLRLRSNELAPNNGWLKFDWVTDETLDGKSVNYFLAALSTESLDRKAAIFTFDVGSGTQDLGFRSDILINFLIK